MPDSYTSISSGSGENIDESSLVRDGVTIKRQRLVIASGSQVEAAGVASVIDKELAIADADVRTLLGVLIREQRKTNAILQAWTGIEPFEEI